MKLFLTLLCAARCAGIEEGCGGAEAPFDNIAQGIAYCSQCSYPTHNFNSSCLASSCPSLSSVCPLDATGSVNRTALSLFLSLLTACLSHQTPICDVSVGQLPIVPFAFSMLQIFTALPVNGTCALNSGSGFIQGLQALTYSPTGSSALTVSISAPNVTYVGSFTCSISTSVLNPLQLGPLSAGPIELLNFPSMQGLLSLSLNPEVTVDLEQGLVQTLNNDFEIGVEFNNFVGPLGVTLPSFLVQTFNSALNVFFKNSTIPSVAANFLSTFLVSALQAAQENCAK